MNDPLEEFRPRFRFLRPEKELKHAFPRWRKSLSYLYYRSEVLDELEAVAGLLMFLALLFALTVFVVVVVRFDYDVETLWSAPQECIDLTISGTWLSEDIEDPTPAQKVGGSFSNWFLLAIAVAGALVVIPAPFYLFIAWRCLWQPMQGTPGPLKLLFGGVRKRWRKQWEQEVNAGNWKFVTACKQVSATIAGLSQNRGDRPTSQMGSATQAKEELIYELYEMVPKAAVGTYMAETLKNGALPTFYAKDKESLGRSARLAVTNMGKRLCMNYDNLVYFIHKGGTQISIVAEYFVHGYEVKILFVLTPQQSGNSCHFDYSVSWVPFATANMYTGQTSDYYIGDYEKIRRRLGPRWTPLILNSIFRILNPFNIVNCFRIMSVGYQAHWEFMVRRFSHAYAIDKLLTKGEFADLAVLQWQRRSNELMSPTKAGTESIETYINGVLTNMKSAMAEFVDVQPD